MKSISFIMLLLMEGLSARGICQEVQVNTSLIGSLMLDYEKSKKDVNRPLKVSLDSMPGFEKENQEKNFRGRLSVFKENGDFQQIIDKDIQVFGKWILEENKKLITVTSSNSLTHRLRIVELTNSVLNFRQITDGGNKMLIPKWFLLKKE